MSIIKCIDRVLQEVQDASPGQDEFYQAVEEVLHSIIPLLEAEPKYNEFNIIERIIVPERSLVFRVVWMDDSGNYRTNIGYRTQFNSAIGPYKGGLRFHSSVNLSIIKFLGFEQTFKNSLTGLNIGGAKGGSNFDPKGKSEGEIIRFCQSFMNELYKYIGHTKDIPAGDIGVGGRELGYLFGHYKKLVGSFEGALTGKGINWGGSLGRKEATGFGLAYFAQEMLNKQDDSLKDKICTVSGSGNVAIYTVQKLYSMKALPVTCSDSRGMIYHKSGIDPDTLKLIKEVKRGDLSEYKLIHPDSKYIPKRHYKQGRNGVWSVPCDAAFPCATQNELNFADVQTLYENGCRLIVEGSNMSTTKRAADFIMAHRDILYGPAKAANAGGVATSQLEMSQNASMQNWSFGKVDTKLHAIMQSIFKNAYETSVEFGDEGNLMMGANIAGFRKVADAMIDQGPA